MTPGRMRTSYPDKERWEGEGRKERERALQEEEQWTEPRNKMKTLE